MDDDDCDLQARILAKAQSKLSKLSLDSIRTVHWKETIRKSSASPRFLKCPTDIFTMPHRFIHVETKESPRFLKQLETTEIIAGRKGKLEVIVTGVPKPVVKWYKNWIPLQDNDNIQIYQTDPDHYVLNIYAAQPIDSGLYTCKARNDSGYVNSSAMVHVEANINHKPHVPHRPKATSPSDTHDNEWTSEWSEDASEEFARIRRQLDKLLENFRQNEEIDLLYKKEVANGKYRMPKV